MADLLVRRLEEKVKSGLKRRASKHGRSLEAEAREILTSASEDVATADMAEGSLGALMAKHFGSRGLTASESTLFDDGVREINSTWDTKIGGLFD
jgi:antitoxin FitA